MVFNHYLTDLEQVSTDKLRWTAVRKDFGTITERVWLYVS